MTKKLILSLSSLLLTSNVIADTISNEEAARLAKEAHLSSINALLIFTSQDGLNSGLYHFTKIGADMEIYNLPFSYTFDSNGAKLEYFIMGNVGYSRVYLSKDREVDVPAGRLDYKNHLRTYTAGFGGGIKYHLYEEFTVSGGVEIIYSRSGVSVKEPGDGIDEAITDFFDEDYNQNMSYKLLVSAEYKPKIKMINPYIKFDYELFDTKSSFDFGEFIDFKTQSMVTTVAIGAESNELYRYNTHYLTLEAYVDINHINGKAAETIKFENYASLGAVAYWYTEDAPSWIERYFIELSSVKADGLNGYNIGVGFTIDF